jgi:uncharacterized membrane protein AbrB (regulator of aidB expression)
MDLGSIHLDAQMVRTIFIVFLILFIFAIRMTKGTAKETPEGLTFSTKPAVTWIRYIVFPIYLALIFYPFLTHQRNMPVWFPIFLVVVLGFLLYQMPGTIVLTSNAIIQHFWLRGDKTIQYPEVMAIQAATQGRTRVLGDNRTTITHTINLSDSARFRTELTQRTNKTLT